MFIEMEDRGLNVVCALVDSLFVDVAASIRDIGVDIVLADTFDASEPTIY